MLHDKGPHRSVDGAPKLVQASKARTLPSQVGFLWRGVRTKSGPRNYAPYSKRAVANKDVRDVHNIVSLDRKLGIFDKYQANPLSYEVV